MAIEDAIKEMEAKEDVEGLKRVAEEAGLGFQGDIERFAQQAIARLSAKTEATKVIPAAQIKNLGGSIDEAVKRTEAVDAQIDAVQTDSIKRIAEVEGNAPMGAEQVLTVEQAEAAATQALQEVVEGNIEPALKEIIGDVEFNVSNLTLLNEWSKFLIQNAWDYQPPNFALGESDYDHYFDFVDAVENMARQDLPDKSGHHAPQRGGETIQRLKQVGGEKLHLAFNKFFRAKSKLEQLEKSSK